MRSFKHIKEKVMQQKDQSNGYAETADKSENGGIYVWKTELPRQVDINPTKLCYLPK